MILYLFLLLTPVLILVYNFFWKRRALPPGPIPLPLFGNTLEIRSHAPAHELYKKWRKQYGPVYTIWLAEDPIVLVADFDVLKETFAKDGDSYRGRKWFHEFDEVNPAVGGVFGVIRTEGENWLAMRRFATKTLRELGMGRSKLESQMVQELNLLFRELNQRLNAANVPSQRLPYGLADKCCVLDIKSRIDQMAGSMINRLLFGYGFDDEKRQKQLTEFKQNAFLLFNEMSRGRMVIQMPWLRWLPYFNAFFNRLVLYFTRFYNYFEENIHARIELRKSEKMRNDQGGKDATRNDFIEAFLSEIDNINENKETNRKEDKADEQYFTLKSLRVLCFDIYIAGQESVARTLSFLVLYLLLDQRVQQKVHSELDNYMANKKLDMEQSCSYNGQNDGADECSTDVEETLRSIRTADRMYLPYTNAVINEVQRLMNLFALSFLCRTTRDVEVAGFKLPKGTQIVPQISCVLYDEKHFPNPENFCPERFLDENGQLKKCDQLIPFGIGKRQCLGESLARMELFLFVSNFFLQYSVFPADPLNPPSAKNVGDFTAEHRPYQCKIVKRSPQKAN